MRKQLSKADIQRMLNFVVARSDMLNGWEQAFISITVEMLSSGVVKREGGDVRKRVTGPYMNIKDEFVLEDIYNRLKGA